MNSTINNKQVNNHTKKPVVFIVDDSHIYMSALANRLEKKMNCKIYCFRDAESCINKLDKKPDIILSDYYLAPPGSTFMNGDSLVHMVKSINPKITVIVYSSQNDIDKAIEFIKLGASDYISKTNNSHEKIIKSVDHALNTIEQNKRFFQQCEFWTFIALCILGGGIYLTFFDSQNIIMEKILTYSFILFSFFILFWATGSSFIKYFKLNTKIKK